MIPFSTVPDVIQPQTTNPPPAGDLGEVAPDPVDEFPYGTVEDFIPPNPVSIRPAQLPTPAPSQVGSRASTYQQIMVTADADPVKKILPAQGNRRMVSITVEGAGAIRVAFNESDARANFGYPANANAPVVLENYTGAVWCNTGALAAGVPVFMLVCLDATGVL